jgi:NitT/TauT family transport system permease protein
MTDIAKSNSGQGSGVGLSGATGIASGLGGQGAAEMIAIIAVAVFMIGGGEFLLRFFEVPQYISYPP